MRLTNVLLKHRPMFLGPQVLRYPGSAFRGKKKFVPPATRATRYLLWLDWRREEEVLKYTSKPYVTAQQEIDYLTENTGSRFQDVDPLYTSQIEKPMQQRYAIDILERFERNRQHEILE